jgi:4-diphosphocytidyl-2-C-methyl-D-erythritol kinase
VSVRAYAKLNLCLEVLNRRTDGFHNLRTVFQTISLHDTIDISWERARRTSIEVVSSSEIPGRNLAERAAEAMLSEMGIGARVALELRKRIPMGGGLGGGSSDAAAVLLALQSLAGKTVRPERLAEIAAQLGSDVPFFLTGGTSIGLGPGTELYPVAEPRAKYVLVVAPDLHVSTAGAYAELRRGRNPEEAGVNACERLVRAFAAEMPPAEWVCSNDFEVVVFDRHRELAAIKRRLVRARARPALMTGSGACLFGIFETEGALRHAESKLSAHRTFRVSFVDRKRYRAQWARIGIGLD